MWLDLPLSYSCFMPAPLLRLPLTPNHHSIIFLLSFLTVFIQWTCLHERLQRHSVKWTAAKSILIFTRRLHWPLLSTKPNRAQRQVPLFIKSLWQKMMWHTVSAIDFRTVIDMSWVVGAPAPVINSPPKHRLSQRNLSKLILAWPRICPRAYKFKKKKN